MDSASAVPPFVDAKRQKIDQPLLSPPESASAIRWNERKHPAESGVEPEEILDALAFYVDAAAVEDAIAAHNSRHPGNQITTGNGTVDAVFIECVHQFQKKCFIEKNQRDGKAGESTLDSLGLVARPGLHSWNKVNDTAQSRLKRTGSAVANGTGGEFEASDWFDHMANPAVFGFTFNRGIHLVLLRKLRLAERHLLTLPAYEAMTPVELGKALGMGERHKGSRPEADTASMHTFGLAIDIGYRVNPWIRRSSSRDAIRRAALLTGGRRLTRNPITKEFNALGTDSALSTRDVYDGVAALDAALREYLACETDPTALQSAIRSRVEDETDGVVDQGESEANAETRWTAQVKQDRRALERDDFKGHHSPEKGFLNLPKDLVIALREHACLAWGGCDIGGGEFGSGDMMHFDARAEGVGRRLARTRTRSGKRGFIPPERRCMAPAAAGSEGTSASSDPPGTSDAEETAGDDFAPSGSQNQPDSLRPPIDLERAVHRNRHHSDWLGWGDRREIIVDLVGGGETVMSDEEFAEAVADWQQGQGLVVDGILGPVTWPRIQQAINDADAGSGA